jgi:concanavalin A-like lectin/glucanase superfamily protein
MTAHQQWWLTQPITALIDNDPNIGQVGYLLHLDNPSTPFVFTDVKGNAWSRQSVASNPATFTLSGAAAKFGDGGLVMTTATGTSTDYTIAATPLAGSFALQPGNLFTLEGWVYWTGHVDSRIGIGEVQTSVTSLCSIDFYTTNQLRFRTFLNAQDDRVISPPLNQWVHLAVTYDGTTKYWFVNGVLIGSAVLPAGSAKTVTGYKVGGTASGNVFAPAAYIDDLRFTYDVCRYTSNFTPRAAAFPNY